MVPFPSEVSKRGWREGVGDKQTPQKSPKTPQKCVPLLPRGHRKKGTEKRPESLAFHAPTPSVRQPLVETSDPCKNIEVGSASSKPTRICTAPFECVKRQSSPARGFQIWVCLFLYGWYYPSVRLQICSNVNVFCVYWLFFALNIEGCPHHQGWRTACAACHLIGNGPNTVSENTVSNLGSHDEICHPHGRSTWRPADHNTPIHMDFLYGNL